MSTPLTELNQYFHVESKPVKIERTAKVSESHVTRAELHMAWRDVVQSLDSWGEDSCRSKMECQHLEGLLRQFRTQS